MTSTCNNKYTDIKKTKNTLQFKTSLMPRPIKKVYFVYYKNGKKILHYMDSILKQNLR